MPDNQYLISPAQLSDAEYISILHGQLFNTRWSVEDFSGFIENSSDLILIATLPPEHTIAGFIVIRVILDEAEILTVGVDTRQQGDGLGKLLCDSAFEVIKTDDVKQIFLEVREDNKKALNLYKQLGFQLVARRDGYYKNNQSERVDGLVMKKFL